VIAKSRAIKDRGGKSGRRAVKAVGFTSGDLRLRLGFETEIDVSRSDRSAEVSRGHSRRSDPAEGLNGWKWEVDTSISKVRCGRQAVLSVLYANVER
jgi:hypothetical protein